MAFVVASVRVSLFDSALPRGSFCARCVHPSPVCTRRVRMSSQESQEPAIVDPVAERVRDELANDGVNFDELLNAGRVVSLTRELDKVSQELLSKRLDADARAALEAREKKLEKQLATEKRSVMGVWLKRIFLVQAVVFAAIGGVLANQWGPWEVPVVGQALGFWMVWLFTIPALRARKGIRKFEKSALNIAFLVTPFLNVGLAAVTKECGLIWASDIAVLAGLYIYYGVQSVASVDGIDDDKETETAKIRGVLRYLDWGSWR